MISSRISIDVSVNEREFDSFTCPSFTCLLILLIICIFFVVVYMNKDLELILFLL